MKLIHGLKTKKNYRETILFGRLIVPRKWKIVSKSFSVKDVLKGLS